MKMGLSDIEGRVLHGLVEEASGDIVLRLDEHGFIVHASKNSVNIGRDLSAMLVMPHIADLAHRDFREGLGDFATRALGGEDTGGWFEFPVDRGDGEDGEPDWYACSLRCVVSADGSTTGALGLLRSIQHKRALEGELHSRAITDPTTGLANRQAFCAAMRREMSRAQENSVVVFCIDGMRALFLQYGQRTADEILWGFARFLEGMAMPGHIVAQIDGERLAVLLTGMGAAPAREWAQDVVKTFASLALPATSRAPRLTASAGVARLECTVDWTLRQAELCLVMARAGGGAQVGRCGVGEYRASRTGIPLGGPIGVVAQRG